MNEKRELIISSKKDELRLDKYLAKENDDLSRNYIQQLIDKELVLVNNRIEKKSYQLKEGDEITLELPEPEEVKLKAEKIDFDLIYEDENLLVLNKPAGLVIHPGAGHSSGTLVNGLLEYCDDLSGINGELRPGIVHRLDKDTSGAMVVAKNDRAHRDLAKQFKERKVKKTYLALVYGKLKHERGKIDAAIGRDPRNRKKMTVTSKNSKRAVSNFEVLSINSGFSLLKVEIETGRTHQIRVHLDYINYPIVGDPKYGSKNSRNAIPGLERQFLHAYQLGFKDPITDEFSQYQAELSSDLKQVLNEYKIAPKDLL